MNLGGKETKWWRLTTLGLPGSSVIKNPPANAEDMGSIPGLGRSPGKGNGNPFQYSCLGNPIDKGAWWATVHSVTKESDTTERLNNNIQAIATVKLFLYNFIEFNPHNNFFFIDEQAGLKWFSNLSKVVKLIYSQMRIHTQIELKNNYIEFNV